MAFTPETFVVCSKFPLFRASCNLWLYVTNDTLEDCLVAGYFQPRMNAKNQDSPEVGDIIQVIVESSKIAYLKIVAKTEKPYTITVSRTYLENEATLLALITELQLNKADKTNDFVTPITDENLGITQAEQADLEDKIDLAANSGRMITSQGFWYAKMYAATVAPSAEDGTNYADFSQVDGQGNPIIVTYNRVSGAWVQDQTIIPPADYDGYVPITSKIWDISEQDGQQGGRILWNHTSKQFTPYPTIVSFDSVEITGDSTVVMPVNPDVDNIPNVGFVLDHITGAGRNVGDIFFTTRKDNSLNGAVPCDGSTYLTTSYIGSQSPGTLLANNKLPYVDLATYASLLSANGSVGVFGWDGAGTTQFRVPTLTDIFIETGTAAQLGDYISPALPNVKDTVGGVYRNTSSNSTGALNAIREGSEVRHTQSGSGWDVIPFTLGVDASKASAIYKDSATTVQPNTIRYRAMVQLSTGHQDESGATLAEVAYTGNYNDLSNKPTIPSVYNPTITITQGGVTKGSFTLNQASDDTIDLDAGGGSSNYHPDLFDWKWADHQIDDMSWLRADTFSWQAGSVYESAYQHLADDIDGKTLQSETIGSTTIQFYLADDGHKICPASEESNVAAIYTATGVAWYYIIDTVNEQFKLPRTKFGVTGYRDGVGNYVAPGVPNITGTTAGGYYAQNYANTENTGAFSKTISASNAQYAGSSYKFRINTFDASLSNSIYGNSTTVQPPATQMYLYFYVGEFTQTAIENTAGLNASLFNGKVDVGHEVIAFQAPTAQNNYTWYRKYADGWVEQGGISQVTTNGLSTTITMPVEMLDTNYTLTVAKWGADTGNVGFNAEPYTTTQIKAGVAYTSNLTRKFSWQVSGMAAS